jgi:uncharacterized oxidoreductase
MNLSSNVVLVTGGASGIGRAIAERFLAAGSEVVVCGRREEKLRELAALGPRLTTLRCDIGSEGERERLMRDVLERFPSLNVVVNNAGIQRRVRFQQDLSNFSEQRREIAINLEAPIHFSALFLPHLRAQPRSAIVNVSSGLAFVPAVFAPVYAATKAALHSFSMSLRRELAGPSVRVVEIIPPAVDTELGGPGVHAQGVPLDEFADAVMARVAAGELEIGFGFSEVTRRASREALDEAFERMNARLAP